MITTPLTLTFNPTHSLETALALVLQAHAGQKDKAGQPCVLHLLRISNGCLSEHAKVAALLHDILEDTPITAAQLREAGIPEEAVTAVELLTKNNSTDYATYINRIQANAIAREVKVADLRDNLTLTRLQEVGETDLTRLNKYLHALRVLTSGDR